MASARINYNPGTFLGGKLAAVLAAGQQYRMLLQEFDRIVEKYVDDTAGITADSGIAGGDVSLVRNLLAQSMNEVAGTAIVQVNVGAQTGTRQLLDAMGR